MGDYSYTVRDPNGNLQSIGSQQPWSVISKWAAYRGYTLISDLSATQGGTMSAPIYAFEDLHGAFIGNFSADDPQVQTILKDGGLAVDANGAAVPYISRSGMLILQGWTPGQQGVTVTGAYPPPSGITTATAAPIPTPTINAAYPSVITLASTPVLPDQPDVNTIPVTNIVNVTIGGKNRQSTSLSDLQGVLDAGGSIQRTDGSAAFIQNIKAPGWTGNAWLADGNPLNVLLGMGWFPGQRDLISGLQAQGAVFTPTLQSQPDVVMPSAMGSPLTIAALIGAGLYWWKHR